jgi:hypothetical protein
MSCVLQNIDPHPPLHPASVYPPPLLRGEDTLAGWRGGGGSIFWKTQDTALYSTYIESSLGRDQGYGQSSQKGSRTIIIGSVCVSGDGPEG